MSGRTTNPRITEGAVSGATVAVVGDAISLTAVTDEHGQASFTDVPISADKNQPTRVNVSINAPGYAPFTYLWVPLRPDSVLKASFRALLTSEPQVNASYYSTNWAPPRRPPPTLAPLLTPPSPPTGAVELYGTADETMLELRGWSGDSKYVLFQLHTDQPRADRHAGTDVALVGPG